MAEPKIGRKRGAILTAAGEHKLQAARTAAEQTKNFGQRYTKEQLSEMSGLSYKTISKIFGGGFAATAEKFPVDKQTLDLCFATFNLTLERQDYTYPDEIVLQTGSANDTADNLVISHRSCDLDPGIDCGEAPDVATFYGRERELERLTAWAIEDRCRTIAILGMGGIGKTALVTKLARQIHPHFEAIVWRSLSNAPPLAILLPKLIEIFSARMEVIPPTMEISAQISCLLHYFRERRCLLILDNAETILDRSANPGYAELLSRIGASEHQSCLLLTSREQPAEIAELAGEKLPVRTLVLPGLTAQESERLFDDKGLSASRLGRDRLVANYSGNPLALRIVSTSIGDLFDGDIDRFLATEAIVFGDIRQLLDVQFAKLAGAERAVMYWLAIEREWVSIGNLHAEIVPPLSIARVLEALELLNRKSLIEHNSGKFTQQAVVMEYMTARFIDRVVTELTDGNVGDSRFQDLPLWLSHTWLKAQSPEYIHVIQTRLILDPIADRLLSQFGHKLALTQHLKSILASLHQERGQAHYGGGNLINLFRHLHIDLTGYDFSNLPIWQADLQGAILHDVNFSGANFAKTLLTRTFGWVSTLAFSPDGQLLATGEHRGDIHLWRVGDKDLQHKLIGHSNWIWEIAFSPDGQTLASASQDRTIRLWDVATGALIHVLPADGDPVLSLSFHPNGKILVTGHGNGDLRLWDVTTGAILNTLTGHFQQVFSIKFSPDGRSLATGGDGDTVKIWDGAAIADGIGSLQHTLKTEGHRIWSLRFSPDGKLLAVGSNNGTIQIWDRSTWQVLGSLPVYPNWLFSMSFSPDSQMLAAGERDYTIKIWDVRPDALASSQPLAIATMRGHQSLAAALRFSPDGKLLATGGGDRSIRLWDTGSWQELYCWQGYNNWIPAVTFTTAGTQLITGSQDGLVRIWDVRTGQIELSLNERRRGLFSIDYNPQVALPTIASASGDGSVKIWDANGGKLLQTISQHQGAVWKIKFSPDGRLLASSGMNRNVYIRSIAGALVATLVGHPNLVKSLAFSPNSKLLATGCFDGCWRLWDVNTSQMLGCYPGHTHWIWEVAFSPDGTLLATASADTTAKLWDVATGELVRTLAGHTDEVMAIAFSPQDRQLATGSIDRSIKIWEIDTGELLQTLTGHLDRILSLSYSPDGKLLASGSADETIKFWDLQTGTCTRTCKLPPPYQGMNITGATGLTPATIATLKTLGAFAQFPCGENKATSER